MHGTLRVNNIAKNKCSSSKISSDNWSKTQK